MAGVSQVTINSIALDIDPSNYLMISGRRRGSVHRLIDGGTVYQDRGMNATDYTLQLSGMFTDKNTLKSIFALYQAGTALTIVDFKGNTFSAIFTPGVDSFQVTPIYGSNIAFNYTMLLSITSAPTWLA